MKVNQTSSLQILQKIITLAYIRDNLKGNNNSQ